MIFEDDGMFRMRPWLFAMAIIASSALPAAGQDNLCPTMREVVAALAAKDLTKLRGPHLEDGVANKIYRALTVLPGFKECEFVESGTLPGRASDRALSCSLSERIESAANARAKTLQGLVEKCFPQAKLQHFPPALYLNQLPGDVRISINATGPGVFFDIARIW